MNKNTRDETSQAKDQWEQTILEKSVRRSGRAEAPSKFYTPLDVEHIDFLEKIGFPGQYPFTAGSVALNSTPSPTRVNGYSGYGTADDTRQYHEDMRQYGYVGGPNLAFSLSTMVGCDSDDPRSIGEVGKAGVSVDTLEDFEILYQAFTGENNLNRIHSYFVISSPANIILAMYVALAEKRGISPHELMALV